MVPKEADFLPLTRRALLKGLGSTPLWLRASPLSCISLGFASAAENTAADPGFHYADVRLIPHYPARSPLQDVLRQVAPGLDEFPTELYAWELGQVLQEWSRGFKGGDFSSLAKSLKPSLLASSLVPQRESRVRGGGWLEVVRREYPGVADQGREQKVREIAAWLGNEAHVETAEFEITAIKETAETPLAVSTSIRYDVVISYPDQRREERVGVWRMDWSQEGSADTPAKGSSTWRVRRWEAQAEHVSRARGPVFLDVTKRALGGAPSYREQMLRGCDYWRTVLDGACGIDVYGNNGVAAGDFDNDGWDDLYVSQPAGLPNRLYRNRGDGTFDDVTEKAGVGVLDNTACALFADFRNVGLQDLLVVCGTGPLLFVNQGDGAFRLNENAFQFARPPEGTFTHAAIADYDGDGKLDIYFCLYSYYLGLDQYHYPVPYFDARNGPPNFLLHNQGDGTFVDRTDASGLQADNNRYSFAAAWGQAVSQRLPDLYVANDFGRNNFYRNNGDGTFRAESTKAHVEDVGAGMSACWADVENNGHADLYVANMWSAAGQRVSQQKRFHEKSSTEVRELFRRHASGNALYRNQGEGIFHNASQQAGVEMGRWAWCSDFWDFDHDGYSDLYVTNGYISVTPQIETDVSNRAGADLAGTARQSADLGSFFWRQVVAKSPDDSTPSLAYEHGWNALNELIRSDNSWSGYERNVMFANNHDGTFSEISGVVGLDFVEDGRSFALADLDKDGRLEVILKSRNAPQLRILHNAMHEIGDSIAFRLRGTQSNRDGIGTAVTVEVGDLRQTRYLQAGSGFLAQHSKELVFGLGGQDDPKSATVTAHVRWPSGLTQQFAALPRNHRIDLEEGSATFAAHPFSPTGEAYAQAGLPAEPETLPVTSEAWLMQPLKSPEFSLPAADGNVTALASMRGTFVLLYFWGMSSSLSINQLGILEKGHSTFVANGLSVLPINVDDEADQGRARSLVTQKNFPFAPVFATNEVAGIYNIVYRYLFDRRKDLSIPSSFLLDQTGQIVKIYQGRLEPDRVNEDVRSVPTTPAERMRRALPFAGTLHLDVFQRNDFTYGVAMFQHGYLDQAEESFRQVVAAKPNHAEGYYNLGTLSLRRKDYAQAREYLQQTLKLQPNYPEAWNNLGMIAAEQNQPEEAIRSFEQSLSLRPKYAIALLNLGNVYRRQGEQAKAQKALTSALELEPDDPEANYSLGMLYAQQNQLEPASEYLTKALTLRPEYPEALNNMGIIYVRKEQYGLAEEQFRTCVRVAPSFDQSYLNLARLYVLEHDKQRASVALEDLLRLQPESAAARQGLDWLNSMP